MSREKTPSYDPEAGLPEPEAFLGEKANPESVLAQHLRDLENRLSNTAFSGEKHAPMVLYQWMDSQADLYALPDQAVHERLLKSLVFGDAVLRQKILHAMEVEASAIKHGIKDYPVKGLAEEILDALKI